MKLSVITDEISLDFSHALDVMAEYDVRSAEIRGVWDGNIVDLSWEKALEVKAMLDDRGFVVSAIASPFFKCPLTDDEEGETGRTHLAKTRSLDDQMALLDRCVELAKLFDARLIRVFSFWKRGPLTPEIDDRIAEAFVEPVKVAERNDLVLALENEHACYHGTGVEAARLIEKVGSPNLRAVWDPGNAFFAGEEDAFPVGYDAIREHVAHVHVKDAVRLPSGDLAFEVIGEGAIDFPSQFAALKADGYRGFISLETHCRREGKTPEDVSRLCLEALVRMLGELQ
jgi:sugar phosphate isomerase/epimerase